MFKSNRILAVIPARGGSKGIPHKNIIKINGKPLISYTISEALKSKYIDYVLVSTEDKEIASISKKYGASVPFLRPKKYAGDYSKTIDCINYSINKLKRSKMYYDDLILLQPTQPLRTVEDIDLAIEKYYKHNRQSLVSISLVDDNPLLIRTVRKEKLVKLMKKTSTCRRQDMPEFYRVNGCIYINKIESINEKTSFNDNIVPFIMEKNKSIDIDEPIDIEIVKILLDNKRQNNI